MLTKNLFLLVVGIFTVNQPNTKLKNIYFNDDAYFFFGGLDCSLEMIFCNKNSDQQPFLIIFTNSLLICVIPSTTLEFIIYYPTHYQTANLHAALLRNIMNNMENAYF